MYCSTSLTQLPLWPRLPRGLVGLLILSLLFQTILPPTFASVPILPSLSLLPGRWRRIRSRDTPPLRVAHDGENGAASGRAHDLARDLVARQRLGDGECSDLECSGHSCRTNAHHIERPQVSHGDRLSEVLAVAVAPSTRVSMSAYRVGAQHAASILVPSPLRPCRTLFTPGPQRQCNLA